MVPLRGRNTSDILNQGGHMNLRFAVQQTRCRVGANTELEVEHADGVQMVVVRRWRAGQAWGRRRSGQQVVQTPIDARYSQASEFVVYIK